MNRWAAWVQGRRHQAWAGRLNFAGPQAVTAWWAWLVLGLGVAAPLWVSDQSEQMRAAHLEAQAQLKRLTRADRHLRLSRALTTAASSPQETLAMPALAGAALNEAAGMGALLGYPWGRALSQVEAEGSAHQAVMMALSVDLSSMAEAARAPSASPVWPVWHLQAAVRDDAAALAWVNRLPEGRLLTRERLAQPFTAPIGLYELKVNAQMQIAWRAFKS